MDWDKAMETIVPLLILAVIGGIAKVAYDYRNNISIWFKKQKLRLLPANFNVALSVDFKEGLNSGIYYEQIKKNLLKRIDDAGLHWHIKLNDFSDIQKFNNKSEAELFKTKKNIDLIIWGSFTNDGLKKDGESISKISLNFTYGHPDNKERTIGQMVLLDINSKLALKNYWQIIDKHSLNDVEIVSKNIFDIATYILALTLKLYGRIEKSLSLFERLYNSLSSRQDNFRQHIVPHLINCYELIITENGINRKKFDIAKESCKKLLNFKKNNFFSMSNLAVFQYKTGEKSEAEKNVELLLKLYPKKPYNRSRCCVF
jgi:tetratricopeptide (TPR) repeat protein